MKVSLRKTRTFSIDDASLKSDTESLVVWWYGPVIKNPRAQSIPKVVVFLRRLDASGNLGEIIRRETALTHLGVLRIGSVWSKGVSNARIALTIEEFDVSFSSGGWEFVSPYKAVHDENRGNPIPPNEYPLYFSPDKNYLLDFSIPDGRNLLIPCMEFFVRCYGRSTEVKRVFATYPWEEAKKRLFKPIDEPVAPGSWTVKLAKRLYNDDVIFLAHAIHDPYAQRAAKSIYAQIEAAFKANAPYAFLKVAPWFQGTAKLSVAGIPIKNGKTFLGLRILGGSHPQGDTILRDRENTNKVDESNSLGVEESMEERGFPVRVLRKKPDIVDLTDDDEPDHGSSSLEIDEDDFVVLGEPRAVIDVRRAKEGEAKTISVHGGDESAFSTGEPYGSGKGVGHASIHAKAVMDSQGILRDMWNAVRYLRKDRPDVIQSAEWYTFEDGFKSDPDPRLIALEPFSDKDKDVAKEIRNWLFQDMDLHIPRGVLIVRIIVSGKPVYLFEIQRRPIRRKSEDGSTNEGEEAFKGLVFVLDDERRLDKWLRTLLASTRYQKGIVQRLTSFCPGTAHAFKHTQARDEKVPCEAAVRNALRKVGVAI